MDRRKFLVAAGSTAVGTSALVGSGAFSAALIQGRQTNIQVSGDDEALIQLVPGHHNNSDSTVSDSRVYLNDNEQLEISFDDSNGTGINPDSTYQVGAIGSDAQSALNVLPDRPAQSDVLYGEAVGDSETTADDPAFYLRNASDATVDVEIEWTGDTPRDESNIGPQDARAAFVSDSENAEAGGDPDRAGFVLSLDDASYGMSRFEMDSGDEVGLSLIAVLDDVDPADTDGWIGSLEVRAGENVEEEP
jgi:hypothetical protein